MLLNEINNDEESFKWNYEIATRTGSFAESYGHKAFRIFNH